MRSWKTKTQNLKKRKERIKTEYLERYKRKMASQLNDDPDSKLGTYLRSNPNLTSNVPVPQTELGAHVQSDCMC